MSNRTLLLGAFVTLVSFFQASLFQWAPTFADSPPFPEILYEPTSQGSVRVAPTTGVSGEYGTWTVTYTVGDAGIRQGGGIRVQLPDAWHAGPRNSANRLQATDPADEHFVSASTSRREVKLQTTVEAESPRRLVKHAKESVDGRFERYVFVVRVRLLDGTLKNGDTINVVYGDRRGGSRGYRAADIALGPEPILIVVDRDGSSRFRLHTSREARLTALPGRGIELLCHVPSTGRAADNSKQQQGTIAVVDKQSNPVRDSLRVELAVVEGEAGVPSSVVLQLGKGYVQFPIRPRAPGIVRVEARAMDTGNAGDARLVAVSNPMKVAEREPRLKLYWGDLHSHTRYSWDGVGVDSFDYARYVSGLDFYAMTDHSLPSDKGRPKGLGPGTWEEYTALTDRYHATGRFVTIHAYECSFGGPWGHHNVFFRDRPGALLNPKDSTLPELWQALRAGEALTIPHHTGKFPTGVLFQPQNALHRRNFEMYSGHGLSESYDPEHPLAFEKSKFTADSKSLQHPSFLQDAWRMGLLVSSIASSDDHRAQPGKPHYGIVAVRATQLTRDAVFQALFDRHTYATTGVKIILDFSVAGAAMGREVAIAAPPEIKVEAVGTDTIAWLEVLRHLPGAKRFEVIRRWEPKTQRFAQTFTDEAGRPGAIYYTRLMQAQPVRGLAAMAWSSPVWTLTTR